jgi:hypothetical protein
VKLSFLEFIDAVDAQRVATGGARLEPTPAQRAFMALAYDGVRLDTPEAQALFGDVKSVPEAARKTAVAVAGRASGKSLMGGCRIIHLAITVDLSKLQPREIAVCPVIAPDLDTAKQVVRFALGIAETLKLRVTHKKADGEEEFSIWNKGVRVRIAARAASAGGSSIRGRFMPCAVLDEGAFFRDSDHKVNDQDIFDALKPRIAPDGQLVILSSPWIESGLLYDLWRRNFGHAIDAVVAHAPTGLMRADRPDVLRDIELEREVDPEKCARERDAVFSTANSKSFFNPKAIDSMMVEEVPEFDGGLSHFVGGDFAFRRNSTAFCASQTGWNVESKKTFFEITELLERSPRGAALKPSAICKEAAEFAIRNGTDEVISDGHYRETIVEHLGDYKVAHIIAPEGANGKADVYQIARQMIHEGRVRLWKSHPLTDKLVRQLKETSSRALSGGGLSIDNPLWRTGEHGDLVSAFVLTIWRAFKMSGGDSLDVEAAPGSVYGADELEILQMNMARGEKDSRSAASRNPRFRVSN